MDTFEVIELFTQIDAAIDQNEPLRAVRLIVANFERLPDPAPLRDRTAEILAKHGYTDPAVDIYQRIGLHYGNSGQPARAIATAKRIDELDRDNSGLIDRFIALYNAKSPFLDPDQTHRTLELPESDLVTEPDATDGSAKELLEEATELARDEGYFEREPDDHLPPLPLLSRLSSEDLEQVLPAVDLQTFSDLVPVIEPQSDDGELIWTVSGDLTIGEQNPRYRLIPGTLLGMSAYGRSPISNHQSVFARGGSEILTLPADAVERLVDQLPTFRQHLTEASRDALTESALESHAMFEAIPGDGREAVLQHFRGLRIDEGTRIISQDTTSPGLFLILDGEVDIIREDEDWKITIETLGPGAVFGEVGLVSDKPTQANVQMTKPGHMLHLPSGAFDEIASAHPGLAKYAVNLAQDRMDELETTLSAQDLAEISK